MPSPLPVICTKPKTSPRGILRGFPEAFPEKPDSQPLAERFSGYDSELVTDRRAKALTSRSTAILEDADRCALALRERLYDASCYHPMHPMLAESGHLKTLFFRP